MKHRHFRPLIFTLAFLLFASLCHAKFTVYFKDGTSRDVVKIEFKGKNVDLFLTTGNVLTLPADSIDYEATGIQKPKAEFGVSVFSGEKPKPKEPQFKPPPQEELQRQWENSTETVVAVQDFGSIRKGEEARVVSSSGVSYTVVARGSGGAYERAVVQADIFSEYFETKVEKKASAHTPAIIAPATPTQQLPTEVDTEGTQSLAAVKKSHRTKPSLLVPLFMSMAILGVGFGLTIAMAKGSGQKAGKRKKK